MWFVVVTLCRLFALGRRDLQRDIALEIYIYIYIYIACRFCQWDMQGFQVHGFLTLVGLSIVCVKGPTRISLIKCLLMLQFDDMFDLLNILARMSEWSSL